MCLVNDWQIQISILKFNTPWSMLGISLSMVNTGYSTQKTTERCLAVADGRRRQVILAIQSD